MQDAPDGPADAQQLAVGERRGLAGQRLAPAMGDR
jgi:hypothetical protein